MPMPKPNDGESHDTFVNRCMGDAMMNGDFPEGDQRRAVCERQWSEPRAMKGGAGCRLSIDDCRMVLRATDFAGQAETIDVLIAPDGTVKSTSGDFTFDEESWAAIDKAFSEHATMLVIDYEHQTLGGDYASPDGTSPAAGWVKVKGLRYEKGKGLVAAVAWTERARNLIRAGEYQYVSPVLIVRKADGKAIGLHSVGLTNRPAIVGMERIAAKDTNQGLRDEGTKGQDDKLAAGQRKDRAMNELLLIGKDLGLAEADCKVETITNKVGELKKKAETADAPGATVKAVCKELGLPESAGAEAISAKLKLMHEASANSDKNVARLAEVEKQLTEIRVNRLHAMLEEKAKINAINPNSDTYKALKALATKDPDSFVVIVNGLEPVIAPGRTTPPEGGANTAAGKEDELIANSVKDHKGDYGEGIVALQRDLKKPYLEQGLTQKAANAACAAKYPKVFAA